MVQKVEKKKKQRHKKKKIEKRVLEKPQKPENIEFEYVGADVVSEDDPNYREFQNIFQKFMKPEELLKEKDNEEDEEIEIEDEEFYQDFEENKDKEKKLSKKKLKLMKQYSVAQLKSMVEKPEVVEVHDVTAKDAKFLIFLKSYRGTIPVPRHWAQKKKYLKGKIGIEKKPFQLPDYIEATGIAEIRDNKKKKSLKIQARERMNPKLGKLDIDYQILHDAFFKHQKKSKLTNFGELYYEGREYEIKLKHLQPGKLTDRLKKALGMPVSESDVPPPWLINMQQYGPPPSYPNLKIPGLNAPIPSNAQWGYQPGGWGRAPVNQDGIPLYGDVFGNKLIETEIEKENIDTTLWGELEEQIYMDIPLKEAEEEKEEEEEIENMEEEEDLILDRPPPPTSKPPKTLPNSKPTSFIEMPQEELDLRK